MTQPAKPAGFICVRCGRTVYDVRLAPFCIRCRMARQ